MLITLCTLRLDTRTICLYWKDTKYFTTSCCSLVSFIEIFYLFAFAICKQPEHQQFQAAQLECPQEGQENAGSLCPQLP